MKKEMTGKIERIGILPTSELQLRYVLTIQNSKLNFICFTDISYNNVYDICLAKIGDKVSFNYNKKNEIKMSSFKNMSINK